MKISSIVRCLIVLAFVIPFNFGLLLNANKVYAAGEFKWPWPEGKSWLYTQGWHSNGIDIGTTDGYKRVLAANDGVIEDVDICNLSANITIRHTGNVVMMYRHIDKNQMGNGLHVGKPVFRGQALGYLRPNTWSDPGCGYTNQSASFAHVHWELLTNTTIDIEGWKVNKSSSCFKKYYPNGTVADTRCPGQSILSTNAVYSEGSELVSQTVPSTMVAGQTYPVSYTFKNTGNSTWQGLTRFGHSLVLLNFIDDSVWNPNRVQLNLGENIAPGQTKTFDFNIKAPSTPGNYNFQWQMDHHEIQIFGQMSNNVNVQVVQANQSPTIQLTEPSGNDEANTNFNITWNDSDADSNANISLYYDNDNSGLNGTLIASNISEDSATNSYTWDTTNIPAETYYIYALINDGVNPPVSSYSSSLNIVHEFNPASISGLSTWLDASKITGVTSGATISAWNDASGNNNNAVQTDVAKQPAYIQSVLNGKPVVRFTADAMSGTLNQALSNNNVTVFTVAKGTETRRQTIWGLKRNMDAADNSSYLNLELGIWEDTTPDSIAVFRGNDVSYSQSFFATGDYADFNLITMSSGATNIALRLNGNLVNTLNSSNVSQQDNYILGSRSTYNNLEGDIAEILVYNRVLSAAEVTQVEEYLQTKYGL